jgi:hypothetical protein
MWEKILWLGMSIATLFMGIELATTSMTYGEESLSPNPKVEVKVLEGYISSDSMHLVTSGNKQNLPSFYYNDAGKLYAITKIAKVPAGTHLKHLWFLRDQIILDATLPVKEDQMRAVSGLILKPNWTGKWRVDITAQDGTLLYSIPFVVQKKVDVQEASAETAPSNREESSAVSHISMIHSPSAP